MSIGLKVQATEYEYDKLDRLTNSYDEMWRLVRVTDGENHSTSYGYDSAGNQTWVRDALGNTLTNTYDIHGRVTSQTDAKGNVTKYAYDANGNCIQKETADGQKVQMEYDVVGKLIRVKTTYKGETIQMSLTRGKYLFPGVTRRKNLYRRQGRSIQVCIR